MRGYIIIIDKFKDQEGYPVYFSEIWCTCSTSSAQMTDSIVIKLSKTRFKKKLIIVCVLTTPCISEFSILIFQKNTNIELTNVILVFPHLILGVRFLI